MKFIFKHICFSFLPFPHLFFLSTANTNAYELTRDGVYNRKFLDALEATAEKQDTARFFEHQLEHTEQCRAFLAAKYGLAEQHLVLWQSVIITNEDENAWGQFLHGDSAFRLFHVFVTALSDNCDFTWLLNGTRLPLEQMWELLDLTEGEKKQFLVSLALSGDSHVSFQEMASACQLFERLPHMRARIEKLREGVKMKRGESVVLNGLRKHNGPGICTGQGRAIKQLSMFAYLPPVGKTQALQFDGIVAVMCIAIFRLLVV